MKKLINLVLRRRKLKTLPGYFDYSSEEKKKIVKKAVQGSNKMQKDLAEKYNKRFCSA